MDAAKLKRALEVLDERPGLRCGDVRGAALGGGLLSPSNRRGAGSGPAREPARGRARGAERRRALAPDRSRAARARERRRPAGTAAARLARAAGGGRRPARDLGPGAGAQLRTLAERGWAEAERLATGAVRFSLAQAKSRSPMRRSRSLQAIRASLGRFAAHLLYGVTGSGKTEVYLQAIAAALAAEEPSGARDRRWCWFRRSR